MRSVTGQEILYKSESVYSVEYGPISHKYVTSVYKSKFKEKPFKMGSGSQTKRGLIFLKEVLDRLVIHYDVPDEIEILSQTEKCDHPEPHQSATDATDATDVTDVTDATQYENGHGINDDKSLRSTNDTERYNNSSDAIRNLQLQYQSHS
ncbi:MAG: hypothetical protein WBQ25_14285 [Nitrososphaeraceae archaeon]